MSNGSGAARETVDVTARTKSSKALTLIETHMKQCDQRYEASRADLHDVQISISKATSEIKESINAIHRRIDRQIDGSQKFWNTVLIGTILILISAIGWLASFGPIASR